MGDYSNDIDKYLKGQLTPAQMNALEKKALSDPFLADALQGTASLQAGELQADIGDLQRRIARRAHKGATMWMWTGRIAAGLLILAMCTFLIVVIADRQKENTGNLALNKEEKSGDVPKTESLGPVVADSIVEDGPVSPDVSGQDTDERSLPAQDVKPAPEALSRAQQPPQKAPAEDRIAEIEIAEETDVDTEISKALREEEKTANALHPSSVPPLIRDQELKKGESAEKADGAALAKRKAISGARAQEPAANYIVNRKIIRGRVTFSDDATGLPGVNVLVVGSNEGTVSDAQGNYQIAVEGQPTLQFSFIGFSTEEVEATAEELNVQLNTDVSELSEVVVVGMSDDAGFLPSTPTVMELAAPEGGRRGFKQYLEQNLQYPQEALNNQIEGKVTVQFTIGMTGQLTDFRVIRGLGFGCDEEVIRLIKKGPKWNPTKKNEAPIQDRVRVRMRFSLPKK